MLILKTVWSVFTLRSGMWDGYGGTPALLCGLRRTLRFPALTGVTTANRHGFITMLYFPKEIKRFIGGFLLNV